MGINKIIINNLGNLMASPHGLKMEEPTEPKSSTISTAVSLNVRCIVAYYCKTQHSGVSIER